MKISLSWLNDYIDIKEFLSKPKELAQHLTAAGIEVEEIIDRARPYQNVVIGHILERGPHPGADRLTLCQVSTGQGAVHQIVCGAKNHKQGDRVVVALPGAVLPGDFAIKKSVIRGVESNGMLCSEKELGLSAESEGIMILPPDAPIGTSFADYAQLNDIIFELKVTPNRADCLSHFGLAREIAAILGQEYSLPFQPFTESSGSTKNEIALEVQDTELCPRYSGRCIRGVKIGPSPEWMKTRLESVGLKSINNVVDVTNYVMMELGQPLHAFDMNQIKGRKIVVAKAKPEEPFKTLDGTEIKLKGSELVIRDGERPVALAGVVGGLNSGVTDQTRDLFIESAYFLQSSVRRTSRTHGIMTDSCYRFERGVNPEAVILALNRACELIQQVAGGEILGQHHDAYPKPLVRRRIPIKASDVSERLGYPVEEKDFITWMTKLECEVNSNGTPGGLEVLPPLYRWDLALKEDLIEEYGRLHGYQHIPETLPALDYPPTPDDPVYTNMLKVSRSFRAEGFQQVNNFGFIGSKEQSSVLGDLAKISNLVVGEFISLVNPLSEDMSVMRVSLVPHLIAKVTHNFRYGLRQGRIFETGYVFGKRDQAYVQKARLGLASWGHPESAWQKPQKDEWLFYETKTHLENALKALRVTGFKWDLLKAVPEFLHPGQSVGLSLRGSLIGFLGTLHPSMRDELKLRSECVIAELDLEKLMQAMKKDFKVSTPSKFPAVERDLAFVIPMTIAVQDVMNELKKAAGPVVSDVSVFDVFHMDDFKRSVAFRLLLQDPAGTLNEETLTSLQNKMIGSVSQKFGIQIR